ncbi:hypothetical protein Tco_0952838 [Tanacetum coccineum]|uniref:Uncharacterized protein n=1 Tax=Tanacetum coccineum TaxID=301880 RepID=A0ABQ5DYN0_9ASTR
MDWLSKLHALVINLDEKIVRIPWGNETLMIHGDGSNQGSETRLNIISCTKTQKYLLKGHHVFLAHVTTKETEDKSGEKRLEDVPIVQNFPEVFLEDLPSLPIDSINPVYSKLNLMPGEKEHEEHLEVNPGCNYKKEDVHSVDPARSNLAMIGAFPKTPTGDLSIFRSAGYYRRLWKESHKSLNGNTKLTQEESRLLNGFTSNFWKSLQKALGTSLDMSTGTIQRRRKSRADYFNLEVNEARVPSDDEAPIEDQPLPADASPVALSPGYVADSDPEEDSEENHADYPADRGDDDDEPSDDDDDEIWGEDEEPFEDEDDDDEEEEHLALADSSNVPITDPVPSAEDTEALETDETAPTPVPSPRRHTARISVRPQTPVPLPSEAEVERLLALPIPPPSPLTSYYQLHLPQFPHHRR